MACLVGPRSRHTEARGASGGHEGEVRGASQLEHCSADFLVSLGKGAVGADTLPLEAVPGILPNDVTQEAFLGRGTISGSMV